MASSFSTSAIPLVEAGFFRDLLDIDQHQQHQQHQQRFPRGAEAGGGGQDGQHSTANSTNDDPPLVLASEEDRRLLRQATEELRLSLAVQYVKDAIARRPLQAMPHSLSQRWAVRIYGHPLYRWLVLFAITVLVALSPLEQDEEKSAAGAQRRRGCPQ